MHTLTQCPQAPQTCFFDEPGTRHFHKQNPVHLPDVGEDGEFESGLSFDEYDGCQTSIRNHAGPSSRRLSTPTWALSDVQTRKVVLAFLEARTLGLRKREAAAGLDERVRLVNAVAALKKRAEKSVVVLDRLCVEYVTTTDPARRRILEIEVSGLDTFVRLASHPDIVTGIIYGYFREHTDARDLAERFGMTHDHVRQLIFRLNACAKKLGFEVGVRVHQRSKYVPHTERLCRITAHTSTERMLAVAAQQAEKWHKDAVQRNRDYSPAEVAALAGVPYTETKQQPPMEPRKQLGVGPTRPRWRAAGLCTGCGGEKSAERVYCRKCLDQQKAYNAKRRARQAGGTATPAAA